MSEYIASLVIEDQRRIQKEREATRIIKERMIIDRSPIAGISVKDDDNSSSNNTDTNTYSYSYEERDQNGHIKPEAMITKLDEWKEDIRRRIEDGTIMEIILAQVPKKHDDHRQFIIKYMSEAQEKARNARQDQQLRQDQKTLTDRKKSPPPPPPTPIPLPGPSPSPPPSGGEIT